MKMIRLWKIEAANLLKVANFPKVGNFKKQEECIKCTDAYKNAGVKKMDTYNSIAARLKAISFCNSTVLMNVIANSKVANFWKVGNLFNLGNFQKLLAISFCYLFICCSSGKTNTSTPSGENGVAGAPVTAIPSCIQNMIDSAKKQTAEPAITEIRRYVYNGARVYLVTAPCCDQFNPVYDSACTLLFHPSGGITGKGDRSQPDFFTQAKEDSLIWKADK